MSQKLTGRNPKRMLVIYKEDMCTSILNIGKVKRILSGEAKLTEGSTVEVEFYGLDYEALVLKLHRVSANSVVVGAADLETFIPSPSSYFVILVTISHEEYRLYNNSLFREYAGNLGILKHKFVPKFVSNRQFWKIKIERRLDAKIRRRFRKH